MDSSNPLNEPAGNAARRSDASPVDARTGKTALVNSLAMIDRSMDNIKAGRTHDAKEAIREIADKLGLGLDR